MGPWQEAVDHIRVDQLPSKYGVVLFVEPTATRFFSKESYGSELSESAITNQTGLVYVNAARMFDALRYQFFNPVSKHTKMITYGLQHGLFCRQIP